MRNQPPQIVSIHEHPTSIDIFSVPDSVPKEEKMNTWNYRVIRKIVGGEAVFAVHEVFYTDRNPVGVTEDPAWPQGDTLEELREDFTNYEKALLAPVLDYEDIAAKHQRLEE